MRFLIVLLSFLSLVTAQTLTIDPTLVQHPVSETLWGVFFEEINHAGQGGLYSEMIKNRNFGGEDVAPWSAVGDTYLQLVDTYPLNIHKPKHLHVTVGTPNTETGNGISNPGFWGIDIKQSQPYNVSFYIISSISTTITVNLKAKNGVAFISQQYFINGTTIAPGDVTLKASTVVAEPWQQVAFQFRTFTVENQATFEIVVENAVKGQELWIDMVSLKPAKGWNGLPFIREDLANYVNDLKPAFVRFPGGCYSEGDRLADRFNWKNALGPVETRPGHWDLWNYYSEDALGLYEYLLFIEQLGSRPIWVVNSGNSHNEQINTKDIHPWVQDALDSLEFAMGDASSTWGSIRASMGHPKPFSIYAVSIGNEDCGKDFYDTNYGAFYAALQQNYPAVQLIGNCDMTQYKQPTQLWDYHVYQSAEWFFQNAHTFDTYPRDNTPRIFNSEYAMTDSKEVGLGNLLGAVSEAVWMTGLERNSDLVTLASYAPLFVNTHDRYWSPDAIVFDSHSAYGTPSYWTQYMFSRAQDNTKNSFTLLPSWNSQPSKIEQSSTLAQLTQGTGTHVIIIKIVNYDTNATTITLSIPTSSGVAIATNHVDWRSMTSANAKDENSFTNPKRVVPVDGGIVLTASGSSYTAPLTLPANSIHILRVYLKINSNSTMSQY